MKLFKNKKGITLVELLAVLVILGIIAAIAVPTVNTLISNTRDRANAESANSYVQAARLYALENPGETSIVNVTNGALNAYVSTTVEFLDSAGAPVVVTFNLEDGAISSITFTGNTVFVLGTELEDVDNRFVIVD